MELSKATTNIAFSVNVWCGGIGDQRICPYIFPQCLSGEIYASVLQDEQLALLENVPLQIP
jgi:hypothetical protein